MDYLLAFLEGIITFISPCLLPMLPVYVLYFVGDGADEAEGRSSTLASAFAFVLGFTVVFLILGAFAGALGSLLVRWQRAIQIVGGAIVILFGIHYLGWFPVRLSFFAGMRPERWMANTTGLLSAFVFGVVFSVTWTPCVGAFLGSALILAAHRGSVIQGMLMLLCYSAGLGILFMLGALLIQQGKMGFAWIKRRLDLITKLSGAFLILMGVLMASGYLAAILTALSVL